MKSYDAFDSDGERCLKGAGLGLGLTHDNQGPCSQGGRQERLKGGQGVGTYVECPGVVGEEVSRGPFHVVMSKASIPCSAGLRH